MLVRVNFDPGPVDMNWTVLSINPSTDVAEDPGIVDPLRFRPNRYVCPLSPIIE
jgi:hypothetical protein